MRQIVKNVYGQAITIELLEKLNLPSSSTASTTMRTSTPTTSCVVVNPSLLSQTSSSGGQQPLLYTTVQPQQKINLLQQTSTPPTLISSTTSLLGQQQQQQQQARAQIVRSPNLNDAFSFHRVIFRISLVFVRSSRLCLRRRTRIYWVHNIIFNLSLRRSFLNRILLCNAHSWHRRRFNNHKS